MNKRILNLQELLQDTHFPNPKPILENVVVARYNHKARRIFYGVGNSLAPVTFSTVHAIQRYKLFKKNRKCSRCGRVGNHLILKANKTGTKISFQFELYCKEGNKLILMTKDHIIPKSKNGYSVMKNYQTMCEECNQRKGNVISIGDIFRRAKNAESRIQKHKYSNKIMG